MNLAPALSFDNCMHSKESLIVQGLYPAVCLRGEFETVRGTIEWATSRGAKRRAGEVFGKGCLPTQEWGSVGVTVTPGNFC